MKILEKLKNLFTKSKRKRIGEDFEIEKAPWTGLQRIIKRTGGNTFYHYHDHKCFETRYRVWYKNKYIPGYYYLWWDKTIVDEEAIAVTEEYINLLLQGKLYQGIKKEVKNIPGVIVEIPENILWGKERRGMGIKEKFRCLEIYWKGQKLPKTDFIYWRGDLFSKEGKEIKNEEELLASFPKTAMRSR